MSNTKADPATMSITDIIKEAGHIQGTLEYRQNEIENKQESIAVIQNQIDIILFGTSIDKERLSDLLKSLRHHLIAEAVNLSPACARDIATDNLQMGREDI